MRALVVDDNDDIAEMLAMLLRRNGYETETASSAFEALAKVHGSDFFCVIISDIAMPGMNGYELARKLRTLPECKNAVMISVTGLSIHGDRERALAAGFDEHIVKPVGALSLVATINRLRKAKAPVVRGKRK